MTSSPPPPRPIPSSLAPVGKLGFRGRAATPEERARIFDALFFEGAQRIPYLQQFFVLMLLSSAIAAFGLVNDSAAVVIGAMLVAPLMTPSSRSQWRSCMAGAAGPSSRCSSWARVRSPASASASPWDC